MDKTMHVLDGVHIEEISDPALTNKLREIGEVKVGDTYEVGFVIFSFNLEVVEVSDNRVVWKHIKPIEGLQQDNN